MAEPWEQDWNRLPFKDAVNVRELGGYPTVDGRRTNYHRFLRACLMAATTPEERDFLYKYGVRCVIDLRGQAEHEAEPNPCIGPDVEMHHVSLYETNLASVKDVDVTTMYGDDPTIAEVYGQIVCDNRDRVARVFKIMASAPKGVVLFNCMVGKDRTGIIAFLLLMLAGVDKFDCIANYLPSSTHLRRWDDYVKTWESPDLTPNTRAQLDSTYDTGEFLHGLITDKFGGIENYLLGAGVTQAELETVRERLVG